MIKANIMIVEDEFLLAADLQNKLESLGYKITTIASSGEQSLKMIDEDPPDLVLMDIKLKGDMDGIEIAQEIKTRHRIPVVYLTAFTEDIFLSRAKITEPFGYLVKPFETRELHSTIEMALYAAQIEAERKLAVDEIVHRKEEWESTFNAVPDLISILDDKFRIVRVNKAMADKLGVSPEEAVELTCYKHIHGTEKPPPFCPHAKLLSDGKEYVTELHLERFGGEFLVSVSPLRDKTGRVIGSVHVARDVTERKRAEEALKSSEERFRRLTEVAEEGIAIHDQGVIVEANETLAKMFGYELSEMIGMYAEKMATPETWKTILKHIDIGYNQPYEGIGVRKNGTTFHVQVTGKPYKYRGKMLRVASFTDITKLKKAEELLKKAHDELERRVEERTAELEKVNEELKREIENHKRAQEVIKQNYEIQSVSNQIMNFVIKDIPIQEILEQTLNLVLSIPWTSFLRTGKIFLVEDSSDILTLKVEKGYPEFAYKVDERTPFGRCLCGKAAQTQKTQFAECLDDRHEFRYKKIIPHGHFCVPIIVRGKTSGVISVCLKEEAPRDRRTEDFLKGIANVLGSIIALKQADKEIRASKELLQNAFDGISDPLILLNQNMNPKLMNKAACEYFRTEKFQNLVNMQCFEVFRERSEPCEERKISTKIFKGQTAIIERKGVMNSEKEEQVIIYPLENGEELSALVRINDITQAKQMERELAQADKMISLGILASGVAHEVNNPNNLIMLNTPMVIKVWESILPILENYYKEKGNFSMGGLPYSEMRDEMPNLLTGIEKGSKRIKQIVKGLKDFVRPNRVTMDQSVDINEVLRSAISLTNNMINKSTNRFKVEYGDNLPSIAGNMQRLEQVMINLIQNACQALHDKEKGIFVTSFLDEKRNCVVVEVRDEGEGIPEKTLAQIFDPFYTTKRPEGGIGLGLSVSSSIVKEHDGEIEVESKKKEGSTFKVFLAIGKRKEPIDVLIADDDPEVRELLREVLWKHRGYSVREAANGLEAFLKIGQEIPDLLILDIQMPDMDGVEVCRFIKEKPELTDIKVIIITGYPHSSKTDEIAGLGFGHMLTKPIRTTELFEIVDKVLGR